MEGGAGTTCVCALTMPAGKKVMKTLLCEAMKKEGEGKRREVSTDQASGTGLFEWRRWGGSNSRAETGLAA